MTGLSNAKVLITEKVLNQLNRIFTIRIAKLLIQVALEQMKNLHRQCGKNNGFSPRCPQD